MGGAKRIYQDDTGRMSDRQTERKLVARCARGDERAWEELYAANAPIVTRFLTRMLGPASYVDDLVQQVFVEVFSGIRRFRGEARVSTWLYGIARNVAWRHLLSLIHI